MLVHAREGKSLRGMEQQDKRLDPNIAELSQPVHALGLLCEREIHLNHCYVGGGGVTDFVMAAEPVT